MTTTMRSWTSVPLVFVLSTGAASAAQLSGTATRTPQFAQAMVSTNLQYAGGQPYSSLSTFLICLDVLTDIPPDGPVSFTDRAGGTALRGGSGAAGIAAIHWLFDQYYLTYFKNGTQQQQWAFQYAVWEIGNDFNGNVSSIDPAVGASRPVTGGYFDADPTYIAAYQAMYQGMTTTLPTLPTSYRSTQYTLDLFKNSDPTLQDMVALVEAVPTAGTPTPVPTMGWWSLLLTSTLLGSAAWRYRPARRG